MTADRAGAARAAAEAVGAGVTTGLSAFPLTPLRDDRVDEHAYAGIVERLARAGIDSIGALGSTGSYAYLDRAERRRVAELTVRHAGGTPVIVGISALRTSHARALAHDAQAAGAAAVMLAPMSYQPLTADDVVGLHTDVATELSVPMVVYDNPGTTRFDFTPELYARLTELPAVASIKIPPPRPPPRPRASTSRGSGRPSPRASGWGCPAIPRPPRRSSVAATAGTPSSPARCPTLPSRSPARRWRATAGRPPPSRTGSPHCGTCSPGTGACGWWQPSPNCSASLRTPACPVRSWVCGDVTGPRWRPS